MKTRPSSYKPMLEAALAAARQAGDLLRAEFHRSGGPRGEGHHAEVDEEAEWLIRERLTGAFPACYRGEETGWKKGPDREHVWLVDPNDGTSSYLAGWRGSAVSIALLRKGMPVLGVVHAFGCPDDSGDLFAWAEGCGPLTRNGRPVAAALSASGRAGGGKPPAIVFLARGAERSPEPKAACVAPARFIALPSIAYRLALVAAGEGVAAVALGRTSGWDYAAGHALLIGAGGVLIDGGGQPAAYDPQGVSGCSGCFGGVRTEVERLRRQDWHGARHRPGPRVDTACLCFPGRGEALADPDRLSRAQGCLLGQFAGDSLGGLVEFRSAAEIAARYPEGPRLLEDGGHWEILAGQPTDDSEMALMLARNLVKAGSYHAEAALDAYLHWYASPPFDLGGTIAQALHGAREGKTTGERLAGARRHALSTSQANGSLMRISPLGVFCAGSRDPAKVAEWARADSRLTHPHPVCQDACAAFAGAIARAIATGCSPAECHRAALEEAVRGGFEAPVIDALRAAAERPPADYLQHQGWVLIALQNAFYQLLHAPDVEEGGVRTVRAGGDTDTNGAIAGALLGAVHGREAIPAQWRRSILSCRPWEGSETTHPRPPEFWPVDALRLAEALVWRGMQPA